MPALPYPNKLFTPSVIDDRGDPRHHQYERAQPQLRGEPRPPCAT